jgi:hypothetical protein
LIEANGVGGELGGELRLDFPAEVSAVVILVSKDFEASDELRAGSRLSLGDRDGMGRTSIADIFKGRATTMTQYSRERKENGYQQDGLYSPRKGRNERVA